MAAIYSTDLGIYLSGGVFVALMQVLVWSMARHSADTDVWRTGAFCAVVGVMAAFGLALGGLEGVASAVILGAVCGWIVLGYVFELETWQRGVMAGVGPIAAGVSLFLGYWMKGLILGALAA